MLDLVVEWAVVFNDGVGRGGWWRGFTRPGFRHVVLLGRMTDGRWLMIDLGRSSCTLGVLDDDGARQVLSLPSNTIAWVKPCHRDQGWHPRVLYCVTMAKHILGLRCWAVTPWQLYRHLVGNHGGRAPAATSPIYDSRSDA